MTETADSREPGAAAAALGVAADARRNSAIQPCVAGPYSAPPDPGYRRWKSAGVRSGRLAENCLKPLSQNASSS